MNDILADNWAEAGDAPSDARCESAILFPTPSTRRDPLRRQQALVAMGRRVVAPPKVDILLQDAAALIAEVLDAECHLVAELRPEGGGFELTVTSRPSDGDSPQKSTYQASDAGSESLVGHVLQVAHPVVVGELAKETRFQDAWLRKHGITNAVAVPLKLPNRAFGVLAACSRRGRQYEAEDILFAETIAHLVTAAIARMETERALERERQFSIGVLQTVGALVLVLDPQGRIRHINRACERITGFTPAELRGRPIWDALIAPGEGKVFQVILRKLQDGISSVECEGLLLTKHSQQRNLAWSYSAVAGSQGDIVSIIATGIDITEQRAAEDRATRAEEAVAKRQTAGPGDLGASSDQTPSGETRPATPGCPADVMNQERRRRPRRSYPYRQLIAPVVDGRKPLASEFVEIECNDIGAGGFSYLAPKPPQSNSLIVALGAPPKLTYLNAEVAHVTRVKQQDGPTMYLIGCTYIGRMQY